MEREVCELARRSYRNDTLVANTPYMHFSIFLLAWTLVFYTTTLLALIALRRYSSLNIKTSWVRIICFSLSCFFFLIIGPFRDVYGYERFICDYELWCRTSAVFCLLAAYNLEISFLRNKIALAQVLNRANFKTLQEFAQRENNKMLVRWDSKRKLPSARITTPISDLEEAEEEQAASEDARDADAQSLQHQLQRAFWKSSKTYKFVFIALVNLTPLVICVLVIQFSMPFYGQSCVNCLLVQYHMVIVFTFGIFPLAPAVYWSYKLRREPDPKQTLHKLLRNALVFFPLSLIAVVLYCINWYVGSIIDRGIFSPDWLLILALNVIHYLETVHEIYLASRPKTGAVNRAEFETLLQDAEGLALFTMFLESEYNAENIRFYAHAKAFRENFDGFPNAVQAKMAAEEIYWTFCHQGSVLEINLPEFLRKQLYERINTSPDVVNRTVFELAEREILNLMMSGSYIRFTRTKEFRDWLKASHFIVATQDANHRPSAARSSLLSFTVPF